MTGPGEFGFHFGVDIAAPDGTAVYAVESGVATIGGTSETRHVHVDHGSGFSTDYWHIVTSIANGQHVTGGVTPLGRVMKGYEHVHLTELRNGVAVNPLAPGHLTPYADRTRPSVAEITFRSPPGEELLPEYVHGFVDLVVRASDSPATRVPGKWSDLPVAPAYLSWRLERVDGPRVVPERVALDVRSTLPPNRSFWRVHARGTRQNMCSFQGQRAWRLPGVYVYRLTRDAFDTRRLPNGIYRLVVTARDTRDNTGSAAQMLIVRNNASF